MRDRIQYQQLRSGFGAIMNQTASTLISIVMLAAFVLLLFGARFAWVGTHRKQGVLMMVAAVVLVGNVLIWVV
jgi:hypothetical protein